MFRVDLALRPNGQFGPPGVQPGACWSVLPVQGREWERFAWLKSRVVAAAPAVASGRALALRSTVTPFVYRRYLDYGVFESLRQLHAGPRRGARAPPAAPSAPTTSSCRAAASARSSSSCSCRCWCAAGSSRDPHALDAEGAAALAAGGRMKPAAVALSEAYVFLRRSSTACSTSTTSRPTCCPPPTPTWPGSRQPGPARPHPAALLERLGEVREVVATEFDACSTTASRRRAPEAGCRGCAECRWRWTARHLAGTPAATGRAAAAVVRTAADPGACGRSKLRLARLMAAKARAVADDALRHRRRAALHRLDAAAAAPRELPRAAVERPEVQRRLLRLLGLARWPMRYLMRHPASSTSSPTSGCRTALRRARLRAELEERHAGVGALGRGRRGDAARHAAPRPPCRGLFRTLVRDVEGHVTVEQVADDLSALGRRARCSAPSPGPGSTLQAHRAAGDRRHRLRQARRRQGAGLRQRPRRRLPLRRRRDEPTPTARRTVYGAFVRKLITWLTLRTPPASCSTSTPAAAHAGNSGLLVSSMTAYERYQDARQQHCLPEHQALTYALRRRLRAWPAVFEAAAPVLMSARDAAARKRAEVQAMRERVRVQRIRCGRTVRREAQPGRHDGRRVRGCRRSVLTHGAAHEELLANAGNIALPSAPRPPGCCRRASGPRRRVPRPAPGAALGAPGRAADAAEPARCPRSATRCSRCGTWCSARLRAAREPLVAARAAPGSRSGVIAAGGAGADRRAALTALDWQPNNTRRARSGVR